MPKKLGRKLLADFRRKLYPDRVLEQGRAAPCGAGLFFCYRPYFQDPVPSGSFS